MSKMKYEKRFSQKENVRMSKRDYNLQKHRLYNAGQYLQQIRRCGPVKHICPKCMQEMKGDNHECR